VSVHRLQREQLIERPLADVFQFFSRASNLEEITPPWLRFGLVTREPIEMGAGTVIEYKLRLHGLPLRWVSRIEDWQENRMFVDRQIRGPYRVWRHKHEFTSVLGGTHVRDQVDYALPLGLVGEAARICVVDRDLTRIFDYRLQAVADLLG
jgi:ligand-binding SRPBCC domain-containing protein